MKISRDSASYTNAQIIAFVAQYANLGLTHVTVDSYLDGSFQTDQYILNWVNAIRAAGLNVWWRGAYTSPYTGIPSDLTTLVGSFPTNHPTYFANGDIYDMLPESTAFSGTFFGSDTTTQKANWNTWLQNTKVSLDSVFSGIGKSGVITGITSITDFNAQNYATAATYAVLGYACQDMYPVDGVVDPYRAAATVAKSLIALNNHAGVPVVIGEFGFTRNYDSDQSLQRETLRAIFNAVSRLSFVAGFNYWCGHGGAGFGSYCNLLEFKSSAWVPRAARATLGELFTKGRCTARMTVI